jgi:hypothetical protein
MLDFNSLASVAKGNILSNISLHTIPPIGCLEVIVHLIPSWVDGISGLVDVTLLLLDVMLYLLHLLVDLFQIS